jgi:hypothetical protein
VADSPIILRANLDNFADALADRPDPQITLETGVATFRLRAATGRTRPLARVSVQDNGPGIPDAMLARLFTPFSTSKPHGTGLGLAICKGLVEQMGGSIRVDSRVGAGTSAADTMPEEIDRKISIRAKPLYAEWQGHKVCYIDTPGAADFVERRDGSIHAMKGQDRAELAAGDLLALETPGGGGFGVA